MPQGIVHLGCLASERGPWQPAQQSVSQTPLSPELKESQRTAACIKQTALRRSPGEYATHMAAGG